MQVELPLDDIIQKKVQEAVAEALKQDRLYTVKDLAQRYQCSEDTIRRDIRDGKFGEGNVIQVRNDMLRVQRAGLEHYEACSAYACRPKTYRTRQSKPQKSDKIWRV